MDASRLKVIEGELHSAMAEALWDRDGDVQFVFSLKSLEGAVLKAASAVVRIVNDAHEPILGACREALKILEEDNGTGKLVWRAKNILEGAINEFEKSLDIFQV